MTWADTQLRTFIDRVLRLKEEQDALAADIKEVYAEAKANGFDKTIMGQLVAFLRKREKDPHKAEENGAIFDLYLHAYDNGTNVALAHAHEADLPPHDEDGVIIETTFAPGVGVPDPIAISGDSLAAKGDAGESACKGRLSRQDASPINSEPASAPSDAEAGQGEGRAWPSSVAPPAISDVPANGPATGQVEPFAPVPGEEACRSLASSPINSEFNSQNTPMIGEGQAVGALSEGHVDGSQACLPSDRAENKPCATAVIAGAPSQSADAPQPADAPGECSPSRDCTPGAPHSGEMPDLPAFLDRRRISEAAT